MRFALDPREYPIRLSAGFRHCSHRNCRTRPFDQPSLAIVRACSGPTTTSVSPSDLALWWATTWRLRGMVVSRSAALRPLVSLTI
jgi:hypothetical protein